MRLFSHAGVGDDQPMKTAAPHLQRARMAALDLTSDGEVPEWVHLLPTANGEAQTQDARGPYHVADAAAIIAASFADQAKLQIDENHSEDLRASKGEPSPARGWITEMQARADGIWGKVEWTASGRALVADKAYRAMSPVILHDAGKKIASILRASLVNRPNFRGLATLNQETAMNPMDQIAEACGLSAGASADAIVTAIQAMKGKDTGPALQSALAAIGTALGVVGTQEAILAAAAAKAVAKPAEIAALQAEMAGIATELTTLKTSGARAAAEAFVDGAIKERRVGVKPLRDHYIARHMVGSADVEKEINAMPTLGASGMVTAPPAASDGAVTSLNAEQVAVAAALGIPQETYLATLKADRAKKEA